MTIMEKSLYGNRVARECRASLAAIDARAALRESVYYGRDLDGNILAGPTDADRAAYAELMKEIDASAACGVTRK